MTVSISYNKNRTNSNKSISHVLFFGEKINILSAKKFVSKQEYDLTKLLEQQQSEYEKAAFGDGRT